MKHFGENTIMYRAGASFRPPPPNTNAREEDEKNENGPAPHPELFILLAMRRLASRASPDVGRNYEELGKIVLYIHKYQNKN
jgi:hypothetical protein